MKKKRRGYYSECNNIEPLGSILGASFKRLGLDYKIQEFKIVEEWEKIVDSRIALVSKPDSIKFKVLFVNVLDHIWVQHLTFLKEQIIDKINQYAGKQAVKKIYFRIGNID